MHRTISISFTTIENRKRRCTEVNFKFQKLRVFKVGPSGTRLVKIHALLSSVYLLTKGFRRIQKINDRAQPRLLFSESRFNLFWLTKGNEHWRCAKIQKSYIVQCLTIRRLFAILRSISKKHVEYSNGKNYLQSKICDRRTRQIYCCNHISLPSSNIQPTEKPKQEYSNDVST